VRRHIYKMHDRRMVILNHTVDSDRYPAVQTVEIETAQTGARGNNVDRQSLVQIVESMCFRPDRGRLARYSYSLM